MCTVSRQSRTTRLGWKRSLEKIKISKRKNSLGSNCPYPFHSSNYHRCECAHSSLLHDGSYRLVLEFEIWVVVFSFHVFSCRSVTRESTWNEEIITRLFVQSIEPENNWTMHHSRPLHRHAIPHAVHLTVLRKLSSWRFEVDQKNQLSIVTDRDPTVLSASPSSSSPSPSSCSPFSRLSACATPKSRWATVSYGIPGPWKESAITTTLVQGSISGGWSQGQKQGCFIRTMHIISNNWNTYPKYRIPYRARTRSSLWPVSVSSHATSSTDSARWPLFVATWSSSREPSGDRPARSRRSRPLRRRSLSRSRSSLEPVPIALLECAIRVDVSSFHRLSRPVELRDSMWNEETTIRISHSTSHPYPNAQQLCRSQIFLTFPSISRAQSIEVVNALFHRWSIKGMLIKT